jgi:Transcriptional regulators
MIMQTLYDSGHRKFGLVDGDIRTPNLEARAQAFAQSIAVLGLSERQQRSYRVPTDASLAAEVLRAEFQRHRPPSALICLTDNFAYGCLHALSLLHFRVPGDVSVMGFDDLPSSRVMHPPLSTIKVPIELMLLRMQQLQEMLWFFW